VYAYTYASFLPQLVFRGRAAKFSRQASCLRRSPVVRAFDGELSSRRAAGSVQFPPLSDTAYTLSVRVHARYTAAAKADYGECCCLIDAECSQYAIDGLSLRMATKSALVLLRHFRSSPTVYIASVYVYCQYHGARLCYCRNYVEMCAVQPFNLTSSTVTTVSYAAHIYLLSDKKH